MRFLTVLLTLLLVSVSSSLAQLQYASTVYAVTEAGPAASADFNRDGRPDIAVSATAGVNILLNTGAGRYGDPILYASASPGVILAADVNGDGWPDLVNSNYQKISVLLNNQNGTFRSGPQFTAADAIVAAAGDFNRDGKLDVVVSGNSQLQIFKGSGTGAFSPGQILRLSGNAGKVEAEDMNRDGILDLVHVVPTKGLVWRGKGDGSFGSPILLTPATTAPLASSVVADFNNDGIPDLAISASQHCPDDPNHLCGTNLVFVYRNNGSAVFTQVSSFSISIIDNGVLYASDLNGDQNADLIVAQGGAQTGHFDFALGKGNGTFGPGVTQTGMQNSILVLRDLDLDSRHDFVLVESLFGEIIVNLARSGYTNCATPGSGSLKANICLPPTNATTTSPVLVRASGNSPVGVKRLEVWIDGKKMGQRLNDQLAKRFTLSPGIHRIAVVAVDKYCGSSSTARQITVK